MDLHPLCRHALLVAVLLLSGCTGELLNPISGPPIATQETAGDHQEITFATEDGLTIHGRFLDARTPARGTIVFLDGAENITPHISNVDWLPERGYNVLVFNYRSYGNSEGEPSLNGFEKDLRAAIRTADTRDDLPRDRLVVFGQSLGGSVAAVTVAHMDNGASLGALVVDSSPTDWQSIVSETLASNWYTWPLHVPLSWLVTDKHRADKAASRLPAIPKLWIANPGDDTVPAHHGKTLSRLSSSPSALWLISARPHMATMDDPGARNAFVEWLDQALTTRLAQPAPETADGPRAAR